MRGLLFFTIDPEVLSHTVDSTRFEFSVMLSLILPPCSLLYSRENERMSRTTITCTISLPPKMAKQLDEAMEEEGRTRSELVREALRVYFLKQSGHPREDSE